MLVGKKERVWLGTSVYSPITLARLNALSLRVFRCSRPKSLPKQKASYLLAVDRSNAIAPNVGMQLQEGEAVMVVVCECVSRRKQMLERMTRMVESAGGVDEEERKKGHSVHRRCVWRGPANSIQPTPILHAPSILFALSLHCERAMAMLQCRGDDNGDPETMLAPFHCRSLFVCAWQDKHLQIYPLHFVQRLTSTIN